MWDFTGLVEGKCINTTALFYCEYSYQHRLALLTLLSHLLIQHPYRHMDSRLTNPNSHVYSQTKT